MNFVKISKKWLLKILVWAGEIAQPVKVFAAKLDDPRFIPRTHMVKERTNSPKLSSWPPRRPSFIHTHIHTHKKNVIKI